MCIVIQENKRLIDVNRVIDFIKYVAESLKRDQNPEVRKILENNKDVFELLKVCMLLYILKKHIYHDSIEKMEKDLDKIIEYLDEIVDKNKIDPGVFKLCKARIKEYFRNILDNDTIMKMVFIFLRDMSIFVDDEFKFAVVSRVNMMTMLNDKIIESVNEIGRLDLYTGNLKKFNDNLRKLSFDELVKFTKNYFDACFNTIEDLIWQKFLKQNIIDINIIKKEIEKYIEIGSKNMVISVFSLWIDSPDDLNLICGFILDYYKNRDFSKIKLWLTLKYILNVEIFRLDDKTSKNVITDLISRFFRSIVKFNLIRFFDDEEALDLIYQYVKKVCVENVYVYLNTETDNPFNLLFSIIYLFLNPNLLKFINLLSKKKNTDKNKIVKEIVKKIYEFEVKNKNCEKIKKIKEFTKNLLGDNYIDTTLKIVINIIDGVEPLKTVFNEENPDLNMYDSELMRNIIEYVNKNNIIISIINIIIKNNKEIESSSLESFGVGGLEERLKQKISEIYFCYDTTSLDIKYIIALQEEYKRILSKLYLESFGALGS